MSAWPSPPRRGPSGASRSEGRGWALTPVRPRPIPPARRGDRPPGVASCRARHATRRCRGPRSPCPSRRPGHARCGRPGCRRRRPGRGSAPRCVRRSPRCRRPAVRTRRCGCQRGSRCPVSRRRSRKASAQRMACVGPSNVVRWPSPVLFTTVPPNRSVSSAVISPKRWSTARHRSSPVAAACCVEATMSVNNTVRRARCDCDGAAWLPVRKSSIPVSDPVGIGEPGRVVHAVDLEHTARRGCGRRGTGRPAPERGPRGHG